VKSLIDLPWTDSLHSLFPAPNSLSISLFIGWYSIQLLLHIIVPGYNFLGWPLPNGDRLYYKVNGLGCYFFTISLFFGSIYLGYLTPSVASSIIHNWGSITLTHNIFGFLLAGFLHIKGLFFNKGNPSGNALVDYFYGYEMNPRFYNIISSDVKWFMEGRALILWTIHCFLFGFAQYSQLGSISPAMFLSVLLHFLYVLHYFVFETNVLAMVDFTADHMGWMLGWGNAMIVPFAYVMPEFYILKNNNQAPTAYFVGIFVLYAIGYFIFANSNLQKKRFRQDPNASIWGKPPKVLKTENGRNLLLSGWWGVARKINYTGDLIQAYCFGLATFPWPSFSLIPFTNALFLTGVTVQRETRDNRWCKAKYGKDWDTYCKLVPYKMIPFVY